MSKNKFDIIHYSYIYDKFGEDVANETFTDVNSGKISNQTIGR